MRGLRHTSTHRLARHPGKRSVCAHSGVVPCTQPEAPISSSLVGLPRRPLGSRANCAGQVLTCANWESGAVNEGSSVGPVVPQATSHTSTPPPPPSPARAHSTANTLNTAHPTQPTNQPPPSGADMQVVSLAHKVGAKTKTQGVWDRTHSAGLWHSSAPTPPDHHPALTGP